MARTVRQVLNRAASILQDTEFARYNESDLRGLLLDGIHHARTVRPDLFIGEYNVPLPDEVVLTDLIPLPDSTFSALGYYVAGNAELRDDEFAQNGRAMALKEALTKHLVQGT